MKDTTERLEVAIPVTEEAHELRRRIEQPDESIEDAWKLCWTQMQAEDTKMIEDWKSQTRDLMLIASIFSGAITIFSSQAMGHPNVQNVASTGTASRSPPGGWPSFFRTSSLALSYLTLILGIGMRRWLHSYTEPQAMTARDRVRLRQEWYTSLVFSQIPLVMRAQPYMLQGALALFVAGVPGQSSLILGMLSGMILTVSLFKRVIPWFTSWAMRANAQQYDRSISLHIPRPSSTPSTMSIDATQGIFDWLHTYRPHCSDTDQIIASGAWTEELPILLRLVKKYGEDYPWAYGNAIISAINFERDCQCAASPSCRNVHLPELVEALCGLPSWSEDTRTDPRRRAGWNLPSTWDCGAMMRILLDERTCDAAIVHTDRFEKFLDQQDEIVEKLRAADKWLKYYRWPSRVNDLAASQPAYFEADLGVALRDLQLPVTHDDEDAEVHRLLIAAGNAICAHHDAKATQDPPPTESRSADLL